VQQAQMGDRHVYAQRTRFIAPAMLRHFDEATWIDANTPHSRKPMPDSVRMLVRERARNAWK
jgi:DNA helicase-2/ATP-dependent DNA helicase PcrA